MQTLSYQDIKKRVVSSFMTLTARQIALRAISFLSINIILARILSVEVLGIFNIATAIISFFSYFSDIGLAASLIQKKETIEAGDLKTTFTIQQGLVTFLSVIIIFFAPSLGGFYHLNEDGIWLVRVLGFCFFLSSLKVLPSILLERELKFKPLVTVEVIETLIFNAFLIFLTFQKFGIWSFSISVLIRGIVGVVVIYILSPVKLRIGIDKLSAKKLLNFGIPYQLNSFLALIKDRLVPLVIARIVGSIGIGYITWSQAMAFLPLEFMNVIIRLTFPAFARLQEDKESLSKAISKSLFVTSLVVYPALFGLMALMPSVVKYVVSSKWQPAVFSFYLFSFSTYWAVISTTLTNALNAMGMIKSTLKLMVFWTISTWILTPLLVVNFGYNGVGISSFIISFSSIITVIIIKKVIEIRVLEAIFLPTVCSLIMALIVYFLAETFVRDRITLTLVIALGALLYLGLIFLLDKKRILEDIKTVATK